MELKDELWEKIAIELNYSNGLFNVRCLAETSSCAMSVICLPFAFAAPALRPMCGGPYLCVVTGVRSLSPIWLSLPLTGSSQLDRIVLGPENEQDMSCDLDIVRTELHPGSYNVSISLKGSIILLKPKKRALCVFNGDGVQTSSSQETICNASIARSPMRGLRRPSTTNTSGVAWCPRHSSSAWNTPYTFSAALPVLRRTQELVGVDVVPSIKISLFDLHYAVLAREWGERRGKGGEGEKVEKEGRSGDSADHPENKRKLRE
uniref:Uncharacterized protein n=1 Tax=Timema bartmani TaxID=61472 RepID=A0A7R9FAX9_9NEOP|nr:unnamed protein product [Timema bartmani]